MAAPPEVTIKDLTGRFVMNKSLSDDADRILELQGVGWFKRRTISLSTITLVIKHYHDNGVEHIDIDQLLTGGIKASAENRTIDWTEREHLDSTFGHLISKSRRVLTKEIEFDHLKTGWLPETTDGETIQSHVVSDTAKSGLTWSAIQTWGFEEIQGARRYARHVRFSHNNDEELHEIKLYYDYQAAA